jgi:hypothetical protein
LKIKALQRNLKGFDFLCALSSAEFVIQT